MSSMFQITQIWLFLLEHKIFYKYKMAYLLSVNLLWLQNSLLNSSLFLSKSPAGLGVCYSKNWNWLTKPSKLLYRAVWLIQIHVCFYTNIKRDHVTITDLFALSDCPLVVKGKQVSVWCQTVMNPELSNWTSLLKQPCPMSLPHRLECSTLRHWCT